MSIERLKTMKEAFMCAVESQMYNLAEVDAEELGEVVDMIKDLSEAVYYCEVTEAMEKAEKEEKNGHQKEMMYYTPSMYNGDIPMYYNGNGWNGRDENGNQYMERSNAGWRDMPRMYYNGGNQTGNSNGSVGTSGTSSDNSNSSQYSEREFPGAFQDAREGRSSRSRRMYMEAKETKQDKATQMRELEKYMQELAQDVVEMVEGASPEERQYLSKKISALATKLTQANG